MAGNVAGRCEVTLPARAETPVDVELLLAVDASGSVDQREFRLQLGGIAQAFADPEVQRAIASGPRGRIAVALMIWSDAVSKKAVSPWMLIDSVAASEGFGDLVMSQLSRRKSFLRKGGSAIKRQRIITKTDFMRTEVMQARNKSSRRSFHLALHLARNTSRAREQRSRIGSKSRSAVPDAGRPH